MHCGQSSCINENSCTVKRSLEWKEPVPGDLPEMFRLAEESGECGSDASAANMFLYRKKYGISICFYKNFYLRRYDSREYMYGYGFPLGSGDYTEILNILKEDAAYSGRKLVFCMLSEHEKTVLDTVLPEEFAYTEIRDNDDYIYSREGLAGLHGKKYHKKKNHVSQFMRRYPDTRFELLSPANKPDIEKVAEQWFDENGGSTDTDKQVELGLIRESLACSDTLRLSGGILYAENRPAAMTLTSPITQSVSDTHFEKALHEYADAGAYAVINQEMALHLSSFTLINREEDLGIEGLRKAKLSYQPDILFTKYQAELKI